jgi:hypothetical protein
MVLTLAGIATGHADDAGGMPDAEKCRHIGEDIAAYLATGHPCACPYSLMRNHRDLCGDRSAWSKPNGSEPHCYLSDFDTPPAPHVSVRVTLRTPPPCGQAPTPPQLRP